MHILTTGLIGDNGYEHLIFTFFATHDPHDKDTGLFKISSCFISVYHYRCPSGPVPGTSYLGCSYYHGKKGAGNSLRRAQMALRSNEGWWTNCLGHAKGKHSLLHRPALSWQVGTFSLLTSPVVDHHVANKWPTTQRTEE